ncbi:MAG TPA: CPBP family intramembrane glutamic endopeptidase [Candidatus Nitrosotalea sp.]|nr:CPBP family intramembrane glutamic endopeptidase [Candidatus Nitrosotalea sp.]
MIFGIMILAFPIGAYLVFDSEIGHSINFQYPIDTFNFFIAGIGYKIPISFQLGDAFIIAWSTYAILFSISFAGPLSSLTRTLTNTISEGWHELKENGLVNAITWFSILILVSVGIDLIQQSFGVKIEPPQSQNGLIQFFQITTSPLTEELGFRVFLIGIPLFLVFSYRASWKLFFKSLWRPAAYLHIKDYKKAMAIIITVGIFFGAAHIISGTPWSPGKITQAAVAGIIIGWVYVRYGLGPAILIHWGTNYFIYSYLFFISTLGQAPLSSEISNPFSDTLEQLLLVTGSISISIKILSYIKIKRERLQLKQ